MIVVVVASVVVAVVVVVVVVVAAAAAAAAVVVGKVGCASDFIAVYMASVVVVVGVAIVVVVTMCVVWFVVLCEETPVWRTKTETSSGGIGCGLMTEGVKEELKYLISSVS